MLRKHFVIIGLFLVAGFLFFNVQNVKAVTFSWSGQGDGTTWTDPKNWGGITQNGYPGQTTNDIVLIATSTSGTGPKTVRATSTSSLKPIAAGVSTLTLQNGFSLILGGGTTLAASSTVSIIGTSTIKLGDSSWGSGTLQLAQNSGAPLIIASSTSLVAATGTVTYFGTASEVSVASTTFYNLNLTPTTTTPLVKFSFNSGTCTSGGCTATTTVSNVFTISAGAVANFHGSAIILSGSGTPLDRSTGNGTFTAGSSVVQYTNATTATNVASGTYANLDISGSSVTKTFLGNSTVATSTTIGSGATLAVGNYTITLTSSTFTNSGTLTIGASGVVTATSATWTNSGTVTETSGGKITYAAAGVLSDSAGGSAVTTFGNADTLPAVHVQITDVSLNLLAASAETMTVTVTGTSGITDSETVTLTETSATSGIFRGSISFQLSGTDVSGAVDYQGGGTLSYAFTDSQDSSDTESGSASFTGTMPGGGGSSSSGGSTTAVTTTTTTTTTTTATPTTETTTATPTTTTAPATTTSGPTLESVQTKVASAIAKVAALPTNPSASELATIQTEIAAILADLQTLQATATPQGAALGYNFVRPLAFGMSHNDVSNLQTALKTDSSIYPGGKVTGYFGPATLLAVKKFQEKYGIASEGQPGYGNVGPKTRVKLNELYGAK